MTTAPDDRRRVEEALEEARTLIASTLRDGAEPVVRAAALIRGTLEEGGKVLVFGNGGSAAEAQHFATELVGRFARERRAVAVLALTADTSVLTALGNDYGFDRVFARQIEALGRSGDVALGISTSGESPNVLAAVHAARACGMAVIGMTGRDGGALGRLADVHVNVAHRHTPRVQEIQLMLLHAICDLVEQTLV
jgi:D-sedoheptulose 7-phosphate isomerase